MTFSQGNPVWNELNKNKPLIWISNIYLSTLFFCSSNRHCIIFWLDIKTYFIWWRHSIEILYLHRAKKTQELILYFLIKWKILDSTIHLIFILLQKWKQILCIYFEKERKKMKVSTIDSCKSNFLWLLVKNETLFCELCISQKLIIELEKYYNPAFKNGSMRLKLKIYLQIMRKVHATNK